MHKIWELKPECTTFTISRVNAQSSMGYLDDLSNESEPESGAFTTLTSACLGLDIGGKEEITELSAGHRSMPKATSAQ
jgi:hypothetical protein